MWQKTIYCGEWNESNAGGSTNYASWPTNPQYWLTVHGDTQMFFHLARQDARCVGQPKFEEAIGCYVFVERDVTRPKVHRFPGDLFEGKQPLFIGSREFSYSCTLPAGNYILMPCTFEPRQYGRFFLSVYSEDPTLSGEMGFGASLPAEVVRVDVSQIALLNRPDSDTEEDEPPQPQPKKEEPKKPAPAPAAAAAGEPVCCVCQGSTKGSKSFRMEGQRYHAKCFTCAACDTLLDPGDFYQDADGHAVCQDCHVE